MRDDWRKFILREAPRYGLDPRAAVAVASQEGLSGRVGDGGHAFGPFQLNDAGGTLTGRPGNHRAFAESRQGIRWALAQMAAHGARGQRGNKAINTIVRNFERPARPDPEVAGAIRAYGRVGAGGGGFSGRRVGQAVRSVFAPASHTVPIDPIHSGNEVDRRSAVRQAVLSTLVGQQAAYLTHQQYNGPSLAQSIALVPPQATAVGGSVGGGETPQGLKTAPNRPMIAHKGPPKHGAALMVALIREAQRRGMHVAENAYVGDRVDPVHVRGSDHYRSLGRVGGRVVNAGTDVSGTPQQMRNYFQWAGHYAGRGLKDDFYTPAGYSYDNGKRWNKTISGHRNHVHVSVF